MQKSLTEERDSAYLGAGYICFESSSFNFIWGTINPRPLVLKHVNALASTIATEGLGNKKLDYAMVAIVDEDALSPRTLTKEITSEIREVMPSNTMAGKIDVIMCAGQHRLAYLRDKHCEHLFKEREQIEAKKNKHFHREGGYAELLKREDELNEEIVEEFVWVVKFYSSRKFAFS
jgi:hypothetical protein